MLISELKDKYPKVYEAAVVYYHHPEATEWRGWIPDVVDTVDGFEWRSTTQGHEFWSKVNQGYFNKAKEICPELFEEEVKGTRKFMEANETVLEMCRAGDFGIKQPPTWSDVLLEAMQKPAVAGKSQHLLKMEPKPDYVKYEYIRIKIIACTLADLNSFGEGGWQLVDRHKDTYTFMRNKQ